MAETWLRELLERAAGDGPPAGPAAAARNALRAGIRLRRRRRTQRAAAAAAVVVVLACAAAVAVTNQGGNRAATPAREARTVYVLGSRGGYDSNAVTPILTLTGQPGRPIMTGTGPAAGDEPGRLTVTPDGKTIWVSNGADTVTPISTDTRRAGKPVRVVFKAGHGTEQVLAAPDGKTVYVLDDTGAVTPISAATHRAGRPIELGHGSEYGAEMVITPDGATLYVVFFRLLGTGPSYLIPINTATNRAGTRIAVATAASAIVVTPDGATVYVIGQALLVRPDGSFAAGKYVEVTPIATATNGPGKPVLAAKGSIRAGTPVAMTPDGQAIYIPDSSTYGVIPFFTATNTPGKLIGSGSADVLGIAIAPDGRTAYVLSQREITSGFGRPACTPHGEVTPIATATNTAGKPIKVGCDPLTAAVTPDGQTIYVGYTAGTVTPIATATGRPGKTIKIEAPVAIVITP
jgi:DNA-binding beta-propeller fold protein YncE